MPGLIGTLRIVLPELDEVIAPAPWIIDTAGNQIDEMIQGTIVTTDAFQALPVGDLTGALTWLFKNLGDEVAEVDFAGTPAAGNERNFTVTKSGLAVMVRTDAAPANVISLTAGQSTKLMYWAWSTQ